MRIPFLVVSFIGIFAKSITSKEEKNYVKCIYRLDGRAGQVNFWLEVILAHRIICLLVTVISLEKRLPRDKTMFVVVSAGVWGKNSLNNWCGYRVQLVLPFFFCTPPCVRDSHFVLASCLTPFV